MVVANYQQQIVNIGVCLSMYLCVCVCCWQIGMSALHWAVQKGHTDTVQFLMQHGANAALPNKVCSVDSSLTVTLDCTALVQQDRSSTNYYIVSVEK